MMSDFSATQSAATFRRVHYRTIFLSALIVASALPLALCFVTFQISTPQIFLATALFSAVTVMNNSHTWITLAYFFNRDWLKRFS